MHHRLILAAAALGATGAAVARPVVAQPTLVPSAAAPYRQKFDLSVPDAQYLLLPEPRGAGAEGPYRFRFTNPALDSLLTSPGTVQYVSYRDGAFHLQVLHLSAPRVAPDALGPQPFAILGAGGEVAGKGALLVVTRAPEVAAAATADGGRTLPVGRATQVRLDVRTHGNYAGPASLANATDYEWVASGEEMHDSTGIATIRGTLRPLRRDVPPPRFVLPTRDGRALEATFAGLVARASSPRVVPAVGGPIYLDAVGAGSAELVVSDLPAELGPPPEATPVSQELTVRDQRFDRESRRLTLSIEFTARGARPAGARETHEVAITSGTEELRARVEVVAGPTVALVGTERGDGVRPVIALGAGATAVRVAGQNLDGLRLDCTSLGAGAACRTLGASPGELVTEVMPGPDTREGEHLLPLVSAGKRPRAAGSPTSGGVRVLVERPAVPLALSTDGLLRVDCGGARCRPGRDAGTLVVRTGDAPRLALLVDDAAVPAEHGWQRLVATVTRVRGDQRQVIRTIGSLGAPRSFRRGLAAPLIPLLDAGADARHGDMLVVKVEHAVEQYPAATRTSPAALESYVRTIFVDGGALTRFAADVSVQPVLYSFAGGRADDTAGETAGETASAIEPLYMNAGIGVTWQPMNWRMQPRVVSAKLQLIGTSLVDDKGEKGARQPALFLSGNLRVPGTDPSRPVVLTGGVARLLAGDTGWRLLAGAGVDLGLSRLMLGR